MIAGLLGKAAAGIVGLGVVGTAVLTSGLQATATPTLGPTPLAAADIPAGYLRDYETAATTCPGLDWTILAGVGKVESDHGRDTAPSPRPVRRGRCSSNPPPGRNRAWTATATARPDPRDPADAIPAAADYLCALGVARNPTQRLDLVQLWKLRAGVPGGVRRLRRHRASIGDRYGSSADLDRSPERQRGDQDRARPGRHAVRVGRGEHRPASTAPGWCSAPTPAPGSRCRAPRSSSTTPPSPAVAAGAPLAPGDLVFFGTGPANVEHVGI